MFLVGAAGLGPGAVAAFNVPTERSAAMGGPAPRRAKEHKEGRQGQGGGVGLGHLATARGVGHLATARGGVGQGPFGDGSGGGGVRLDNG